MCIVSNLDIAQSRVSHGRQRRLAYQSNGSSLEEDQGCSSMDSLENQALPPDDSMENPVTKGDNQSLLNDASLESSDLTVSNVSKSSFEDNCSPCDSPEGRNTPTNSLEKRQCSTNSQDSDTEVSGLDLVRILLHLSKIFQFLLLLILPKMKFVA